MSPGHGLTDCARVYRIPEGAKYLIFNNGGDYRDTDMLQLLRGAAVQIVIDVEGGEMVFVWPDSVASEVPR